MKLTIRILGIVLGVLGIITGITCLTVGLIGWFNMETLQANNDVLAKLTTQQYQWFCIAYMVLGAHLLIGTPYNFILSGIAFNPKIGKGVGMTLGIFGIPLGAEVTGVLTLVDSIIHRK